MLSAFSFCSFLPGFGSCGVIGYFVNPRQGGVIGLQALQLIVVYYSSFYREREVFPLSQLFGQSDTDFAQSQAMLQKFVPITERQLTALCVHKRRIYDKVRRGLCCPVSNFAADPMVMSSPLALHSTG